MIGDLKVFGNITVLKLAFALLVLVAALVGGKVVAVSLRRALRDKVPDQYQISCPKWLTTWPRQAARCGPFLPWVCPCQGSW